MSKQKRSPLSKGWCKGGDFFGGDRGSDSRATCADVTGASL
jgi:hypothetical protein